VVTVVTTTLGRDFVVDVDLADSFSFVDVVAFVDVDDVFGVFASVVVDFVADSPAVTGP
jgi:hypothetical protein